MSSQLQFEAADNDGESGFCVPTEGIQSKGVPPDVVNMLGSVVQTTIPDGVTCPQSSIPTEEMTTCSQEIPWYVWNYIVHIKLALTGTDIL